MIQPYAMTFTAKGFDIREMSATRRSEDGQAPQWYMERVVVSKNTLTSTRPGLFLDEGEMSMPFADLIAYVTNGS